MSNRYSRPVAFNSNNPVDRMIEDYVKNKNFSGTCKRLIVAEMREKGIDVPRRRKTPRNAESVQPKTTTDKFAELNERLKDIKNKTNSSADSETYE